MVPTANRPVIFDPIKHELNSCINIAYFNANSLPVHMHLLRTHLFSNFHRVISISETWPHSLVSDSLVDLDDYRLIRNDREGRRGGEVSARLLARLFVLAKRLAESVRSDYTHDSWQDSLRDSSFNAGCQTRTSTHAVWIDFHHIHNRASPSNRSRLSSTRTRLL